MVRGQRHLEALGVVASGLEAVTHYKGCRCSGRMSVMEGANDLLRDRDYGGVRPVSVSTLAWGPSLPLSTTSD